MRATRLFRPAVAQVCLFPGDLRRVLLLLIYTLEYFRGFVQRHPVFAPYTTPIYSNAAFRILGYVLEAVTNSSFEATMKKSVWEPLSLVNTSASRPSKGVIPSGDPGWFLDLGDEAP